MAKLIPELIETGSAGADDYLIVHDTSEGTDFKIKVNNLVPTSLSSLKLLQGQSLKGEDGSSNTFDIVRNTGSELLFGTSGSGNNITQSIFLSDLRLTKKLYTVDVEMSGRLKGIAYGGSIRDIAYQGAFDVFFGSQGNTSIVLDNDAVEISGQGSASTLYFKANNSKTYGRLRVSSSNSDSYLAFESPDFKITGSQYGDFFTFDSEYTTAVAPLRINALLKLDNLKPILAEDSTNALRVMAARTDDSTLTFGNANDTINLVGSQVYVNGAPIVGGSGGGSEFINRDGFDSTNDADTVKFNLKLKNTKSLLGNLSTGNSAVNIASITSSDKLLVGDVAVDTLITGDTVEIVGTNSKITSPLTITNTVAVEGSEITVKDGFTLKGEDNSPILTNDVAGNRLILGEVGGMPVQINGGSCEIKADGVLKNITSSNNTWAFVNTDEIGTALFSCSGTKDVSTTIQKHDVGTLTMVHAGVGNFSIVNSGTGTLSLVNNTGQTVVHASTDAVISGQTVDLQTNSLLLNGSPFASALTNTTLHWGVANILNSGLVLAPTLGAVLGTWNNLTGHPVSNTSTLIDVEVGISKFVTSGAGEVVVTLEYVVADGTGTSEYTVGSGVSLGTVTVSLPDSSGSARYYATGKSTLNAAIPANSFVFASVSSLTASSAEDITVRARIK